MPLLDIVSTCITSLLGLLTLFPFAGPGGESQTPFLGSSDVSHHARPPRGPTFKPPGGSLSGPGSDFMCDYSNMPGYVTCSTPEDRSCWLKNKTDDKDVYDIHTNYEKRTPIGITRTYWLTIADDDINADGMDFPYAKLFNKTYPGPWIQACWGDNVTIFVNNELEYNGTSVHWHGIRQYRTMHMDGVNGITQCPIAPQDSFNYTWSAMQYGSSWYHSHYSVQYADGAAGPITLHGPTSAAYDEAILPILMTDWGHNSAFEAIWTELLDPSILLDGRGNVTRFNNNVTATAQVPDPYTISFTSATPAKRYLLRLINTSFQSTFIFSIDNHILQIVGADFVPIHPYYNKSVVVGIGQRYHVIVTAAPQASRTGQPIPGDGNFWIRTYVANCFEFTQSQASPGYEKTGILRYNDNSTTDPTSDPWFVPLDCRDEPYSSLRPIYPWIVPEKTEDQNFTVQDGNNASTIYPLAFFSVGGYYDFNPLRIDYSDPTFLNLNYTGKWNPLWTIIPENYTDNDWVIMVIQGTGPYGDTIGAHPIHLHGHDFGILAQVEHATFPKKYNPQFWNPPRRDVALLPSDGYLVITFRTDNPGTWLLHCHIADHAAAGLAMQILERQQDAADIWPSLAESPALQRAQLGCNTWNQWWGDCNNWWPGGGQSCLIGNDGFSPDSGI